MKTSSEVSTLDWSEEEINKLNETENRIKARLFDHNLPYQYFDADLCKEGEFIHEFADGKKELWDFTGNTKPFLIKVLIPNA